MGGWTNPGRANDFFGGGGATLARRLSDFIFVWPLLTVLSLAAGLFILPHHAPALMAVALATVIISTGLGILLERLSNDELGEKHEVAERARLARQQVEELFAMTDMLQEIGRASCRERV